MYSSKIYRMSPIWLQSLLVTIYRFLRECLHRIAPQKDCNSIQEHDRDYQKYNSYINHRLSNTLNAALKGVPFYNDNATGSCLDSFPIIDKSIVIANYDSFFSQKVKTAKIWSETSGTTGSPLKIPQTLKTLYRERSFINRFRGWASYENGDKRAWLRGDKIVPLEQTKPPFWRYSYFDDTLMLSAFHLNENTAHYYIKAMMDFGVSIIQANPSIIYELASFLESKNIFYPGKIKSIMTSSENLTEMMRCVIESRFNCKVFDWYGSLEKVAAIASCEYGRYHVLNDYGFVEFLPVDDFRYEIVATSFSNELFPLIRYRTGDYVTLSTEKDCPCGRVYPLIGSIDGRLGDYLLSTTGQKIFFLSHFSKGISGLISCQYLQYSKSEVTIKYVADNDFDEKQKAIFKSRILEKIGHNVVLNFVAVSQLPRTKNGKVKLSICDVKDEK